MGDDLGDADFADFDLPGRDDDDGDGSDSDAGGGKKRKASDANGEGEDGAAFADRKKKKKRKKPKIVLTESALAVAQDGGAGQQQQPELLAAAFKSLYDKELDGKVVPAELAEGPRLEARDILPLPAALGGLEGEALLAQLPAFIKAQLPRPPGAPKAAPTKPHCVVVSAAALRCCSLVSTALMFTLLFFLSLSKQLMLNCW